MKHFDMICVASRSGELEGIQAIEDEAKPTDTSFTNYFVPSLFKPGNVKDESDLASCDFLTFFVDFHGLFTSKAHFIQKHDYFVLRDIFPPEAFTVPIYKVKVLADTQIPWYNIPSRNITCPYFCSHSNVSLTQLYRQDALIASM